MRLRFTLCAVMGLIACQLTGSKVLAGDNISSDSDARPNIILVVIDTLRADHVGCYGYKRPTTPNIDQLAAQGVLFERCYSTSSWTLPACTSLLSGTYVMYHGVNTWTSGISESLPWLPQILTEQGYYCMGVSSNPFVTSKQGFARGFDVFDDQTVLAAAQWSFPLLESQYKAIVLASTSATATRRAMELLNERATDKPFFLYLHYMDCHADYLPPKPWDTAYDPDYTGPVTGHVQSQRMDTQIDPRDMQHIVSLYDGEVSNTDAYLGQLLEHLEALGLSENTCIVVVADHGEELLDHGNWFHGHTLYEEVVRVPLIVKWPGRIKAGHRSDQLVSLVDVVPTLLRGLGLHIPDNVQGYNLASELQGQRSNIDRMVLMETQLGIPLKAVIKNNMKMIAQIQNTNDAFSAINTHIIDLAKDKIEALEITHNDPQEYQDLVQEFMDMVRQSASSSEMPDGETQTSVKMQQEQIERLRNLGYVGD